MYQLFNVDGATGAFTLQHQAEQIQDCFSKKKEAASTKSVVLFDFSKKQNLAEPEETKIIQELIQLNEGELLRVTKGVTISKNADAVCCGAGSCYCVVSGSSRHCETYYCNANGYCWVVPCSVPCGC